MKLWKLIFVVFAVIAVTYCDDVDDDDNAHHDDDSHKTHRTGDPDISASGEDYDHDAVTGSHHETEEFKELEPEEAKKRLGVLYDRMDIDKDKKLTKPELVKWIIQSFRNLDRENTQTKLEEFDEDRDKLVSWDEFVQKVYGHSPKELEEIFKGNHSDMSSFIQGAKLDRIRFDLADKDKDGKLNLDELTRFIHPQNYPQMAKYELLKTIDDFDKNGDKMIDFNEFMGDGNLSQDVIKHEKESFNEHDKNKDGKLEKDEIISWAMPGFESSAKSEVDHLFTETDENKDDILTKDEVVKQHDLWTGSQATDYGKHLDNLKHDEL